MIGLIRKFVPALVLFILGSLLAAYLVPKEWAQMVWEIPGSPDAYPLAQKMRPYLLLAGCYLPALGAVVYGFMGTMDRYISRCFISSFLLCTAILTLIWLLADFTDNMERFRNNFDDPLTGAGIFYGTQLPMVLNLILPYTLLMGTMWALSKLSGSSEITGMLQSGRSLIRLCIPIFFYSFLVAAFYGICTYQWAPGASMYRQVMIRGNNTKNKDPENSKQLIYKNETDNRIWCIGDAPDIMHPGDPLRNVTVEQFSTPGRLDYKLFADEAVWDSKKSLWTFRNAIFRRHSDTDDIPVFDAEREHSITRDYPEKPFQLITPKQRIDTLGTPAILESLDAHSSSRDVRFNLRTELHTRTAKIFTCLILVAIAIPSSITFQRRTPMKGIGIAILLAALLLVIYEGTTTLGSSGYLPAWLAAWLPNIIYTGIAIHLYSTQLAHRSILECLRSKWEARKH